MQSFAGFDWDDGNRAKCQQHGVSIEEIEIMLPTARLAPDLKHSDSEDRFIATGRNSVGRPMFVAFVVRIKDGQKLLRPISARYMHAKEARGYETESS